MTDLIRVLRVLEYVGPRKAVEHTLSQSVAHGCFCPGLVMIRSAIIGDYPEILGKVPEDETSPCEPGPDGDATVGPRTGE